MGSFCSASSSGGADGQHRVPSLGDDVVPPLAPSRRPASTSPPTATTTMIAVQDSDGRRDRRALQTGVSAQPACPPSNAALGGGGGAKEAGDDVDAHPNPLAIRSTTTTVATSASARRRSQQQALDPSSFQTVRDLVVDCNAPPATENDHDHHQYYPFCFPALAATTAATNHRGGAQPQQEQPAIGRRSDSIDTSSPTVDTPGSDLISGGFRFGSFALELPPVGTDDAAYALPCNTAVRDGDEGGRAAGGPLLQGSGGVEHHQGASASQVESILSSVTSQQLLMPLGPPLGGGGGLRGLAIGGSSVDVNSRRSSQLTSLGGGELTPRRASGNGSERQRRITFLAGDAPWAMDTGRNNGPPMPSPTTADESSIDCVPSAASAERHSDADRTKGTAMVASPALPGPSSNSVAPVATEAQAVSHGGGGGAVDYIR